MKSLIVLIAFVAPIFSALAVNASHLNNASIVENVALSSSDGPSLDINSSNISESTPQNQTSMLYYLIPAAAVLLVIICLIALSKRLLFENP